MEVLPCPVKINTNLHYDGEFRVPRSDLEVFRYASEKDRVVDFDKKLVLVRMPAPEFLPL